MTENAALVLHPPGQGQTHSLAKKIICHPLFILGVVIKLGLACCFASDYLLKLFIPFVDYFVGNGQNPYDFFLKAGKENAFPYPALMLYIVALPRALLPFIPKLLAYRISLFAADCSILFILAAWVKSPIDKVLKLYWLSPVLIYISYIHGQLDVIPVALLFISLYFLFLEHIATGLIILGLSIAAKTSMLLAFPLSMIYLFFHLADQKKKLLLAILPFLAFALVNIVYLADPSFISMVLENEVQKGLFSLAIHFNGEISLYVVPMVYIFLLGQAFLLRLKSKEVFILFLGFAFGMITVFITPQPGWYYWPLPFWIYFYAQSSHRGVALFFLLQACYFLYFMAIPHSDYFEVFQPLSPEFAKRLNVYHLLEKQGIEAAGLVNIVFSFLQSALVLNIFWLYRKGVDAVSRHKMISRPLLVGIGGDSGAGKTTLSSYILRAFGGNNITMVKGDDMHRWERGDHRWGQYTHLDPRANELHQEYQYLQSLKYDQKVLRKSYDHATGKFTQRQPLVAKKMVVYEGLHPFYLKKMRDLFDIAIFVSPDDSLAAHWKIMRDTSERGYSSEEVLAQIQKRREDRQKYIIPQEKYAGVQIRILLEKPLLKIGSPEENPQTYLEFRCLNTIPLEPLLEIFASLSNVTTEHVYEGSDYQTFRIHGNPSESDMAQITQVLPVEALNEKKPDWFGGQEGLIQAVLVYIIIEYINAANGR